ncbi:alanine racemase [Bifidobacterium actinocoloniiforme DSM 22766]|uniref:Alanine racemase n=1 Tax=Bifidobacterium actinocoloniiforme DSM 22766 TaxID=1437605 RepID=A0A086Z1B1_9BIFI|nr:alanine racemase [Bifidobacterium actinocoloniiforme]AKV55469.1 alanine racemase [Bifidobacterium actinocoloniiforme DSM 22766]KFI40311.1 alanine racemase [Bifidobacterium actinocoloniiforme DSM 22766]
MSLNAAPQWDFSSEEGRENYQRALKAYPGQAIVDLSALKANMAKLVSWVSASGSGAQVMGVIKADAYGHGLIPSALAALAGGATWLGSAQPREALLVRRAGIGPERCRILVLMYNGTTAPLGELIAHDIDISVGSLTGIAQVAKAAEELGRPARVHVEVDTGFGRNGFAPDRFDEALTALKTHAGRGELEVVGLWSHLAVADMPNVPGFVASTDAQVKAFEDFDDRMRAAGLEPRVRHLANTAATLSRPEIHYELTRPGIGFYGYEPDPSMGVPGDYQLQPAMTLQAQLGTVKDLPAGHGISYGRTYLTQGATSTAILPLGYADGIHRSASGFDRSGAMGREHLGGPVRLMTKQGPRLARVSGRVCMDQCVLDLRSRARDLGVAEGDTVVLFGPGRGEAQVEPTADDWARSADTISYEIFTCLRNRIPRLYLHAAQALPAEDLRLLDPRALL